MSVHTGEHEPLVAGQLVGELAQPADVVTIAKRAATSGADRQGQRGRLLISPVLVDGLAQRIVGRGLDRSASAEGALAIADAREEALSQRVGGVRLADEGATAQR